MIDIRQMRYFVVLAETLHFGRAAERLHLTQPPLSRQLAALESELGVRLLDRDARSVRLTRAGQRFLADCRAVLASFDQACRNAQLADRGELGELAVGFMMHAAHTVLPRLMRRYMTAYPEVEVRLKEVIPSLLVDDVLTGRFDAAIMFPPGPVRGLQSFPVHSEVLCLAVHADHDLAHRERIDVSDLHGRPLIVTPQEVAPTLRDAITRYFHDGGASPSVRLETQLQQTIVSLVAENLGIALVPESMRKLGIAGVVFRDLENPPVIDNVIVWRPGNLNPALGNFLTIAGAAPAGA